MSGFDPEVLLTLEVEVEVVLLARKVLVLDEVEVLVVVLGVVLVEVLVGHKTGKRPLGSRASSKSQNTALTSSLAISTSIALSTVPPDVFAAARKPIAT